MPPKKSAGPIQPLPEASDPEAERTALGAILIASPPWTDVEAVLSAGDLTVPLHRVAFRAMGATSNGHPLDIALVRQRMRQDGDDDPATTPYLAGLVDNVPRGTRWREYCAPVRALALERRRRLLAADYAVCSDPLERAKLLEALQGAEGAVANGESAGLPWVDLTVTPEPGRWLVRGVIPGQGRLLLVAPSHVGKSWILADLAISVALGKSWLGLEEDFPIQGNSGPVFFVQEEDSQRPTMFRLARLAAGHGIELADLREGLYLSCLAGVNVGNPKTWVQLLTDVKRLRPCLVILDAAIRIIGGSENESEHVGALWRSIGAIQSLGAAVAMAHHAGWVEKDRARGSSDFLGGADVQITLSKTDVLHRAKLTWTKMKDPPDHAKLEPIYVDLAESRTEAKITCGGTVEPGGKLIGTELEDAVLAFISLGPGRTRSRAEVMEAMFKDRSFRSCDGVIKKLKEAGRVISVSRGYEAV